MRKEICCLYKNCMPIGEDSYLDLSLYSVPENLHVRFEIISQTMYF